MRFGQLRQWAEAEVQRTLRRLPPDVRAAAEKVPVLYLKEPDASVLAEGFEPDILGLFQGTEHGAELAEDELRPPQILLYLPSVWDHAGEDAAAYREEVRLTYLHELGHYLGWDEGEVAARGLE